MCEPGGIVLSEDAHRQVRDRLKESFVDLGEKQLKNIARPVRAYALTPPAIGTVQVPGLASPLAKRAGGVALRAGLAAALALALVGAGWIGWRTWSMPRGPAV